MNIERVEGEGATEFTIRRIRAEIIEDCAKACDKVAEFFGERHLVVSQAAAQNCAEDIRALIPTTTRQNNTGD